VRERDRARLIIQQAEGIYAGMDVLHRQPVPEPLTAPRRKSRALNPEAGPLVERGQETPAEPSV
jgi:hypothetical protein